MAFYNSENDCLIIGKEFKKASPAFTTKDGKNVDAIPDRYMLYLAVGDMKKNSDIFKEKPVISAVTVKEDVYNDFKEFARTTCKYRVNSNFPTAYRFYSINGIDILNAIEEEEDD